MGSALAASLVAAGHEVAALARDPARAAGLRALGCRMVAGSLEDGASLAELVRGREIVFHVAGLVAARSPAEFLRVNRDGAARLALAAREAGVSRFLLVSSLAVTGPSAHGQAVTESAGPGPLTAYGRSKLAGEVAVRETGVPLTVVRPPAVYGPRDRAFLPLFRMAARGWVPLLGDGRQRLTLVHVRDLAQALIAAATRAKTLGGVYHAGHALSVEQSELALAVGHALGRTVRCLRLPAAAVRASLRVAGVLSRAVGRAPLLDGDKSRELLAPGWVCSSEALRRDAGWQAEVMLAAGLAETARAYREAGWL